jgi:hypothetical protein
MRVASRLAPIELSDWKGDPVRLGSFWERSEGGAPPRPVVLVFIRHFG